MPQSAARAAPGTQTPRRFRPRLRFELISCGLYGHELLGTDAAQIRPEDELVVRHAGSGLRWYRCLRCDSWLPLPEPTSPTRQFLPDTAQVVLPLRGKALRDKYVLRLIALDRFVHVVLLGMLAVAVFLFLRQRAQLQNLFYRSVSNLQGWFGGPGGHISQSLIQDIDRIFRLNPATLWALGLIIAGYAVLEGAEGIGLWMGRRWSEYLTFTATTLLLIPEIYELATGSSVAKLLTLVVNLAIVVYLLFAKRLFGLRGGGAGDIAQRDRESGWEALRQVLPTGHPADTPSTTPSTADH
jgi:uncharacterized membrane protein (DUF2068 family)